MRQFRSSGFMISRKSTGTFFSPSIIRRKMIQPNAEETDMQRKETGIPEVSKDFEIALTDSAGKGEQLPQDTRHEMEHKMGVDFSNVRIHHGSEASKMSSNIQAKAFTYGNNIYFNNGEYAPESEAGRHLLSHELTHVVQQNKNSVQRRIQRVEYGTYISSQGEAPFLNAAKNFFTHWGYPNIKVVSNMNAVVTDLAKSADPIDKFRIVSHANPGSLEFGLMDEVNPKGFSKEEAKFINTQVFNDIVAGQKLMDDATYTDWTTSLLAEPDIKILLADMNISIVPSASSEKGIFLRAMLESVFLDISAESGTTNRVKFGNRALLNSFNTARISSYSTVIAQGMDKTALAAFNRAKAAFPGKAAKFLSAAGKQPSFTRDEAKDFGENLKNPSGAAGLDPLLTASIREGSGSGNYLKDLKKARDKISKKTHLEIRGCNAGTTDSFLDSFRSYFGNPGNEPTVTAPDLFEYFYQLPFETFTQNPKSIADLQNLWTKTDFAKNYNLSQHIRNKDMIVVIDAGDNTLDKLIKRYGLSLSEPELKSLNPDIRDTTNISTGDKVWLKARKIPVDQYTTTLDDFCRKHLGGTEKVKEIEKNNPGIKDPDKLTVGQMIELSPASVSTKTGYAGAEKTQADFEKSIRGGDAYMYMETDKQPMIAMDDSLRKSALAKWLASQNYGLTPETAADLEKKLGGAGDAKYLSQRYINFLSRSYPDIKDPVLPDDPRYKGHIKKRP